MSRKYIQTNGTVHRSQQLSHFSVYVLLAYLRTWNLIQLSGYDRSFNRCGKIGLDRRVYPCARDWRVHDRLCDNDSGLSSPRSIGDPCQLSRDSIRNNLQPFETDFGESSRCCFWLNRSRISLCFSFLLRTAFKAVPETWYVHENDITYSMMLILLHSAKVLLLICSETCYSYHCPYCRVVAV